MIILGLVLVGLAVAATAGMVIGGGQQTAVEIGGLRVETTTSGFFLFGLALAIALVGGIQLVVVGFKHWRRRRQEIETLRSQAQPVAPQPAAAGSAETEPAPDSHAAPAPAPAAVEGGSAAGGQGELGSQPTEPAPVATSPAESDEGKR